MKPLKTLTKGVKTYYSSLGKAEALVEMFEKNNSDDYFAYVFRNSKSKIKKNNQIIFTNDDNQTINIPITLPELHNVLSKCN